MAARSSGVRTGPPRITHAHARINLRRSLGDRDTAHERVVEELDRFDGHERVCRLVGDRQGVEHLRALLRIEARVDEGAVGADNLPDAHREGVREAMVVEGIVGHGEYQSFPERGPSRA